MKIREMFGKPRCHRKLQIAKVKKLRLTHTKHRKHSVLLTLLKGRKKLHQNLPLDLHLRLPRNKLQDRLRELTLDLNRDHLRNMIR
jgi:hypothetical protein